MTAPASPWVLGARSETGYVRSTNEDRMGWTRTAYGDVFVVSDGMGGYRGGALAAEIVVRTLQERLAAIPPDSPRFADYIRQAFDAANREVADQRRADDPETREMGATAVAVVSRGARVIVAHVGDSRAYRWRARGGLTPLTRDHSRVQSMLDAGLITADEAAVHPEASVLERAIGPQPGVQPDVTDWLDLEPGDVLLLCSDGLCGYVPDADIDALLRTQDTPQAMTDSLIEAALAEGGKDNATVQLMRYAPPRGGALGWLLARPAVLVPLCVGVTAAVVAGAWMVRDETQPQDLQARPEKVDDPQRPVAAVPAAPTMSAPAAAAAAPSAAAVLAPVPAAAPRSSPLLPASTPDMTRAAAAIGQVKGRTPATPATRPQPPSPSARAPTRSAPAPRAEPPAKTGAAAPTSRASRSTPPAPTRGDGRNGAKKPVPRKTEAGSAPASVAPSAPASGPVSAPVPASTPAATPVSLPTPPPSTNRPSPPTDSPPVPSPDA